jgi:hypothetical protein
MKTAIILVGNIRTWDECKYSFHETFDHLNPDIFVSTYNLQYDHHPHIKGKIQDFDDCILTNDQISSMFNGFNVKGFCIEKEVNISEDLKRMNSNMSDLEICFKQYRKFNIGIQMMKHFEKDEKYDCVIKTRCDLIYNKFDINDIQNTVIIDSGNVFPNDCIFISSRDNMISISNAMLNEFFDFNNEESNQNPPHGLLLGAIRQFGLNIESQQIMNCVVRKGGKRDNY